MLMNVILSQVFISKCTDNTDLLKDFCTHPHIKEIKPQCSLEGLIPKLQYFAHLMRRADSLEKTLMLGKIEGRRRRG